ncbi:uncharacterized protein LOC121713201 [Alosa sapidissima]|uniref:uncharacterized protein LOC121713201 n=1 Tax=Alosa sapidissima TaxID=34773 RepID=UPI001C084A89|nr:uncharacterized protein LOC121713201 [Alosa sapidissima]
MNCDIDMLIGLLELKKAYLELILQFNLQLEKYKRQSDERKRLLKVVIENCKNETVMQWLRENEESVTFSKLVDMFHFWKKHIDEEEKKNHGDNVDITFVAHGAIKDFMIPASCLLPLPTITDVVLYAPWNCVTAGDEYGIATGRIQPRHRVFYCVKGKGCTIPDEMHRPVELPDHWNSMKKAGGCKIPNITVSPLQPEEGVLEYYELCKKTYGPPGRNRIFIPFILPEKESVQFSVVMLALSLVLLSSRFKATVHLSACLGDQSTGQKFDKEQLKKQYAYTIDNTSMKVSLDMLNETWIDYLKRWFGV